MKGTEREKGSGRQNPWQWWITDVYVYMCMCVSTPVPSV